MISCREVSSPVMELARLDTPVGAAFSTTKLAFAAVSTASF
jgi:hypothetical protein